MLTADAVPTIDSKEYGPTVRVRGFSGVACRVCGWKRVYEPYTCLKTDPETGEEFEAEVGDGEWVDDPDRSMVVVVMVGDNHKYTVPIEDVELLDRAEFCGECGQIGCTHDGMDRD